MALILIFGILLLYSQAAAVATIFLNRTFGLSDLMNCVTDDDPGKSIFLTCICRGLIRRSVGGSVAILGAAALADALGKHPADLRAAFQVYDESFRPTVEAIQTHAVEFGMEMFLPRSENAIQERNVRLSIR
jgi:hypothetical protein